MWMRLQPIWIFTVEETIEVLAGRECYHYVSLDSPLSQEESAATLGELISSDANDYDTVEKRMDLQQALSQLEGAGTKGASSGISGRSISTCDCTDVGRIADERFPYSEAGNGKAGSRLCLIPLFHE